MWNDFKVSKPTEDGCYLVFVQASTIGDGYCDHLDMACYYTGNNEWDNEFGWLVTHWQELPPRPEL